MKLNNQKSYMSSLHEGEAPRTLQSKITKYIYFAILLSIASYVVYIFLQKIFYFNEVGFVEVNKISISSTRGGRITSLNFTEGEHLEKNSLIAVIDNHKDCSVKDDDRLEKLKHDIEIDLALLDSLNIQIQQNKGLVLSKDNLLRALELEKKLLVKPNNNNLQKINLALSNQANLLKQEIKLKRKRLTQLASITVLPLSEVCFDESITAPFSSKVYSIQKQNFEVVTRAESILTIIADHADVHIELYLEIAQYPNIKSGDVFSVALPDGQRSTAIVESIFSSAYDSADRKWNDYIPVDAHLRVHLIPENQQQAKVWKLFDQMQVKVRGHK